MGDNDVVYWIMKESLLTISEKCKNLNYTSTAFVVWTAFPFLGQNHGTGPHRFPGL